MTQNTEHPQLIFPDGKAYLHWANIHQIKFITQFLLLTLKSKLHQYLLHDVPRLIMQVDENDLSIMRQFDVFYSNK